MERETLKALAEIFPDIFLIIFFAMFVFTVFFFVIYFIDTRKK